MGGWITIKGYCSEGFKPLPSGGRNAVALPPAWASESSENGLATKFTRIEKKTPTAIIITNTSGITWRFLRRLSCTTKNTIPKYKQSIHSISNHIDLKIKSHSQILDFCHLSAVKVVREYQIFEGADGQRNRPEESQGRTLSALQYAHAAQLAAYGTGD